MALSQLLCYCAVGDTVPVVSVLSWEIALNIIRVFLHTTAAGCTIHTALLSLHLNLNHNLRRDNEFLSLTNSKGHADVTAGNHVVHFTPPLCVYAYGCAVFSIRKGKVMLSLCLIS
jgi:hypothetical protein